MLLELMLTAWHSFGSLIHCTIMYLRGKRVVFFMCLQTTKGQLHVTFNKLFQVSEVMAITIAFDPVARQADEGCSCYGVTLDLNG